MKSYKCKLGSFSLIDLAREGLQSKKKKCLTNSITAEEIKWQQGAGEKKKVGQKDCSVLHTRDKWIIFSLCKEAKKKGRTVMNELQ